MLERKNMKSKKKCVVIPVFNEEHTISKTLKDVSKYVDKIIVVDDGSTDNTSNIIKGKKVILIKHLVNLGQGAALQTGFEYVKQIDSDIIVTFDADGQHKASEIPKMIQPILEEKTDITLGSRFLGRVVGVPLIRLIVLKMGIIFTRIYSGLKITDTHNGLRAFTRTALSQINITHNRWAHPSDILYQIGKNNFKIIEIPTTVLYTNYSKGKKESVRQKNIDALKIPIKLISKVLLES